MPTNKMYKGLRDRMKEGAPSLEEQAERTRKHLAEHIMKRRNVTETKLLDEKSPKSTKGKER